jgi:5-methylcytosine-specific restriction protein A
LTSWFCAAHARREAWIEIKAGDLHRAVGGYPKPTPRMPMCCSVMRQAQRPGDTIVSAKVSDGASFTVRYQLPRPE